jgi:hypothetical protein
MSTYYASFNKIHARDLFDGRLEKFGVREHGKLTGDEQQPELFEQWMATDGRPDNAEVGRATIHGKFIGHLMERPKKFGREKHGLTTLALATFDGSGVEGVNTVNALLDPEALDRPETSKEALEWDAGDLVQLEGEVFKIEKCECCGKTLPIVGAFKCARITGTA